jgi:hypothetical protein
MNPRTKDWRAHLLPLLIFGLVLSASIIVRTRLLDAPLERDEGEHGYMAQTLLQGYAPWQLAYNLKLPGTDAAYALFIAIFGQTAAAIRLGLLIVNVATVFLMVLLGKRLSGVDAGLVTGAAYCLLSSSQGVYGTIAHSTHFVVFFAVLATLMLLHAKDRSLWLFATGIAYGLAFLMKQPGLAFGAFGLLCVAWRWRKLKPVAACAAGIALPYGLLCLALWRAGTFQRFWFWTVTLAQAFASGHPLSSQSKALGAAFPLVVQSTLALWILAALGLLVSLRIPATRRAGAFTGVLLIFSAIAVSAGGVFNPHYFVLMLPAIALANGLLVHEWPRIAAISLFGLACAASVLLQANYFFRMAPYEFERSSYGLNPFPEAEQVAGYIRQHSSPLDTIAVVGSEAEIYFYSQRRAATGYLFTYGLMETHPYALPSQFEMIHEIESSGPAYLVFVGVGTSWLQKPGSPAEIFRWVRDYTKQNYNIVGAVNLRSGETPVIVWGPEASVYDAASPVYLTIYRRR